VYNKADFKKQKSIQLPAGTKQLMQLKQAAAAAAAAAAQAGWIKGWGHSFLALDGDTLSWMGTLFPGWGHSFLALLLLLL
jgi:hypothetical protein